MKNKKLSIIGIFVLCLFFLVACNKEKKEVAKPKENGVVLRLEGGDFGYPNPFRHQNRGPGFFKMELIHFHLFLIMNHKLTPF